MTMTIAPATHSDLSNAEIARYSRHLIMPEIGMAGQRQLRNASVLIIGTGGLGSPTAMYLAAAGIGRIGLVDYDTVDESNLQRQVIHGQSTIGMSKLESAATRLRDLNPYLEIDLHPVALTSENALALLAPYDVIIDGTDNFPTRYLVNDACVRLGKPNVYGSIFRFEGQLAVFDASRGPCYRCMFPEPPPPGMVPSCAEGGVLGVLPGTIGTLQATEAIKLLLGIGEPMIGRMLLYDALEPSFTTIRVRKNPTCPVCSIAPEAVELIDYEQFCGMPAHDHSLYTRASDRALMDVTTLTPREILTRQQSGEPLVFVDVREPIEWEIARIEDSVLLAMSTIEVALKRGDTLLDIGLAALLEDATLVFVCRSGIRSAQVIQLLRERGADPARLVNMAGGLLAWGLEVDPTLPIY
jgi:sulfur-carrier protein adenylyltransferase/sulfurtransferase